MKTSGVGWTHVVASTGQPVRGALPELLDCIAVNNLGLLIAELRAVDFFAERHDAGGDVESTDLQLLKLIRRPGAFGIGEDDVASGDDAQLDQWSITSAKNAMRTFDLHPAGKTDVVHGHLLVMPLRGACAGEERVIPPCAATAGTASGAVGVASPGPRGAHT